MTERIKSAYETGVLGALAGGAGGVAEILWVGFYGAVVGNNTTDVARSITTVVTSVLPISPLLDAPVASGIAIHMLAAVALGIALAFALRMQWVGRLAVGNEFSVLAAALALIWVCNFFIVLPILSPHVAGLERSFTEIVPYPVSLFSKLLFGLASAAVFARTVPNRAVLARS